MPVKNTQRRAADIHGNILIRWNYDSDVWNRFSEDDFEFRKGRSKSLFILISSICFVTGLIFFILDHDAGFYVFLVMLGMIAILAIMAYLSAVIPYSKENEAVYIVGHFNKNPLENFEKQNDLMHLFISKYCRIRSIIIV